MSWRLIARTVILQRFDSEGKVISEDPIVLDLDKPEVLPPELLNRTYQTRESTPVAPLPQPLPSTRTQLARLKKAKPSKRSPIDINNPALLKSLADHEKGDAEMLALLAQDLTTRQIADKQGRTWQSVYTYMSSLGRREEARRLIAAEKEKMSGAPTPVWRGIEGSNPIPVEALKNELPGLTAAVGPIG